MQNTHYGPYLNQATLEYNPAFLAKLQATENTSKNIDLVTSQINEKFGKVRSKAKIILQEIPSRPTSIELGDTEITQEYLFRLFKEHFNRFEFILDTHELCSNNGHFKSQIAGWNLSFWGGQKYCSDSILTIDDTVNKLEYCITIRKGLEKSIIHLSDFQEGYVQLVKRKYMPKLYPGNPNEGDNIVYNFFLKGKGICFGTINGPFKTIKISDDLISLMNNLLEIAEGIIVSKATEAKSLN